MRDPHLFLGVRSGLRTRRIYLRADTLSLYIGADGHSLRGAHAQGNVHVSMLTERESIGPIGFAESATYDSVNESVILGGWPEVYIGDEKISGDSPSTRLIMDQDGVHKIEPGSCNERYAGRPAASELVLR